MKIQGNHTFAAPRDVVWPMLQDPDVLARVMPGCEKLEQVDDNAYTGILKIKVGPVQGTFKGDITLSDIQDPESYNMVVNGRGAPGFVKGSGNLRLEADGENTVLHYEGDAQVGGRLASVGQRLLDTSAKAIIRQSLEGLGQQIEATQSAAETTNGAAETAVPSTPAPPSQIEFAAGVAKNMFEEMVPPENREQFFTQIALAAAGLLVLRLLSEWWLNRLADKVAARLEK